MERIIVLVGPPGVGKSTLVKLAKSKGLYAVDIEDLHNETKKQFEHLAKEESKQLLAEAMHQKINDLLNNVPDGMSIFGAGGYGGFFPQEKIERVLLLPDKRIAKARFIERDAHDREKQQQNQKFDLIYDGFVERWKNNPGLYHRVIEDIQTPEATLETIINN